jgi:hypothetical protein
MISISDSTLEKVVCVSQPDTGMLDRFHPIRCSANVEVLRTMTQLFWIISY